MSILAKMLPKNFQRSTTIMVLPHPFREMGRLFDMFGFLDEYKYSKSGKEADLKALKRDYELILKDLDHILKIYEKEKRTGKIQEASKQKFL